MGGEGGGVDIFDQPTKAQKKIAALTIREMAFVRVQRVGSF